MEDLVGMSALSYVDTIRGPLEVSPPHSEQNQSDDQEFHAQSLLHRHADRRRHQRVDHPLDQTLPERQPDEGLPVRPDRGQRRDYPGASAALEQVLEGGEQQNLLL
jgi:hypothetical protein